MTAAEREKEAADFARLVREVQAKEKVSDDETEKIVRAIATPILRGVAALERIADVLETAQLRGKL